MKCPRCGDPQIGCLGCETILNDRIEKLEEDRNFLIKDNADLTGKIGRLIEALAWNGFTGRRGGEMSAAIVALRDSLAKKEESTDDDTSADS